MHRIFILLISLLASCFYNGYGQKTKIIIVDRVSKLPIENVNINYIDANDGTITNSEGKAVIELKKTAIKISHINYEEFVVNAQDIKNGDTIFINPILLQLDEVIVTNFNLLKSIKFVLENYKKLYVNIPFEKECDFKETVTVDNNLKRLILSKVNWWDKSYFREKNDLKLRLSSISHSKNNSFEIFSDVPSLNIASNNGYTVANSIINIIYLNTFLTSFITYANNLDIKIEESPSDIILVSFESDWKKIKESSYRQTGKITFDKTTKVIVEIIYNIEYENNIVKGTIKENNKESISETKISSTKINFYKSLDNKWSLKSFASKVGVDITYNSKTYKTIFENKIYVLKETAMKKVNNNGLIDLTKPIFLSLPSKTITNENSILLTEEEKKFISDTK